jgi:hypothetical protein
MSVEITIRAWYVSRQRILELIDHDAVSHLTSAAVVVAHL